MSRHGRSHIAKPKPRCARVPGIPGSPVHPSSVSTGIQTYPVRPSDKASARALVNNTSGPLGHSFRSGLGLVCPQDPVRAEQQNASKPARPVLKPGRGAENTSEQPRVHTGSRGQTDPKLVLEVRPRGPEALVSRAPLQAPLPDLTRYTQTPVDPENRFRGLKLNANRAGPAPRSIPRLSGAKSGSPA